MPDLGPYANGPKLLKTVLAPYGDDAPSPVKFKG